MLPTSIAGFLVSVTVLPRVLARWGATPTMVTGLLLVGGAQLWLSRGLVTGAYALDVLPGLLLAAVGVAFSFTPTTLVITRSVPADRTGVASGMASASAQLGGAFGIAAFSAIQGAASRGLMEHGSSVADATLGGFTAAFTSAGTTAVLAAVLAVAVLTGWRSAIRTTVARFTRSAEVRSAAVSKARGAEG
jgi:hypothetical protein